MTVTPVRLQDLSPTVRGFWETLFPKPKGSA
jgi:hypothetical protein